MQGKLVEWGSDFTGTYDSVAWGSANLVAGEGIGDGLGFTSVNEGSFASTVDEAGGILAITTDTGDNDNAALMAGKFAPRDGVMKLCARFKYSNVDCAIFVGFTETLALDTPVMPAEFATATMTYNGTGGLVGFNYDVDGTTDDFRAVMGDGGAAISDSSNGIRASADVTADQWIEVEVIVHDDGSALCWIGDASDVDANNFLNNRLVKHFKTGTLLTTTDLFYGVLMVENRSGNARVLEVDYFYGTAGRDWRYN